MIRNFFKVALRNLRKQRFYSLINIVGLAIGLMACLLISLFVLDELSYDRFHERADRIYRVRLSFSLGGQSGEFALAPSPLAPTLVATYPEIESAVRFRTQGNYNLYRDDQVYQEKDITFADSSLFEVFTIPLLYGDPGTALVEPHTMAISTEAAKKYFGADWEKQPPLGETLLVGREKESYQITGIFEKIPDNSHFHFNVFLSMSSLEESRDDFWVSNNFYTYLLVREDADVASLETKLKETFETYAAPQIEQYANASYEDFLKSGNRFDYLLQPLTSIHLYSDLQEEIEANGDIRYVYIFGAIAFFLLIIACVNFMNLSTARSAGRAKEVGIRKTFGSARKQLIAQFRTEAVLVSMIALLLALLLSELLLPYFNNLADKQLTIRYFTPWYFLPVLLGVAVLVGLLAGSYPAFFLSAFRPANVLILPDTYYLGQQAEAFKNEVLQNPNVRSATFSGYLPAGSISNNNSPLFPDNNPNSEYTTSLNWFYIDHDYIPTMGMEMASGRNFSRDFATDSSAIIINEAAGRYFYPKGENPLGQKLSTFGDSPDKTYSYTVVGVVRDFNYTTMRQTIKPMVMVLGNNISALSLRIKADQVPQTIAAVEAQWKQMTAGLPFEYSFLDERFAGMYRAEQKLSRIFTVFCGLAIFIACLGLFGLASYTAEQRTKEIGIRKVLGASVLSLVMMFSKDFARLVLISLLIAAPVAYFIMSRWLEDFAYKIDLGPGSFLLAGGMALLIAWLTVSFQSVRAALADPVKSLRSE